MTATLLHRPPEPPERGRDPLGLGAMRRVEVVSLFVDLDPEVGEARREAPPLAQVVVRVAPPADAVVDGLRETAQRFGAERMALEGSDEGAQAGRARCHPRWRRVWRWRWWLDTGCQLETYERRHEF